MGMGLDPIWVVHRKYGGFNMPMQTGNTGSPSQVSHTTCTGQCWASVTDTQASFFSILPVLSCMGQERIYANFNDLLLHCHQLPTRATDNLKRCKRRTSQAPSLVVAAGGESIRQHSVDTCYERCR